MKLPILWLVVILGLDVALWPSSWAEENHETGIHHHPKAAALKNPVKPTEASTSNGKALFTEHCATCHGPKTDGDSPVGKALNPPAANLTDANWKHGGTDGEMFMVITRGALGTGMISFEKVLSEKDRWDLVNYIRSLGPQKREAK